MATPTINELMEALATVAKAGVNARAWMNGEPTQKPQFLPFLYVQWQATEPTAGNNSVRSGAKLVKKGVKRVHTGTLYVLVTTGPDIGFDAKPINDALDGLLNAIDGDETLTAGNGGEDICQKVMLGRVELFRQAWEENGPVFSGFRAPFTLTQTV